MARLGRRLGAKAQGSDGKCLAGDLLPGGRSHGFGMVPTLVRRRNRLAADICLSPRRDLSWARFYRWSSGLDADAVNTDPAAAPR